VKSHRLRPAKVLLTSVLSLSVEDLP
jgi:hypothetical protein